MKKTMFQIPIYPTLLSAMASDMKKVRQAFRKNKKNSNPNPVHIGGNGPSKQELEQKLARLIQERKNAPLNVKPSYNVRIARIKKDLRKIS